jgi:hypothetical protein
MRVVRKPTCTSKPYFRLDAAAVAATAPTRSLARMLYSKSLYAGTCGGKVDFVGSTDVWTVQEPRQHHLRFVHLDRASARARSSLGGSAQGHSLVRTSYQVLDDAPSRGESPTAEGGPRAGQFLEQRTSPRASTHGPLTMTRDRVNMAGFCKMYTILMSSDMHCPLSMPHLSYAKDCVTCSSQGVHSIRIDSFEALQYRLRTDALCPCGASLYCPCWRAMNL